MKKIAWDSWDNWDNWMDWSKITKNDSKKVNGSTIINNWPTIICSLINRIKRKVSQESQESHAKNRMTNLAKLGNARKPILTEVCQDDQLCHANF